jgi:hypothetical protein
MSGWSTKRKLIWTEVVYFGVDAAILLAYWGNVAGWQTILSLPVLVGLLFTLQFIVSGVSTYLWFVRTDEGDPEGAKLGALPE